MSSEPNRDQTIDALLQIAAKSIDKGFGSHTSDDADRITEAIQGLTAAVLYLASVVADQKEG